MRVFDITPTIKATTPVYPGDVALCIKPIASDTARVSALTLSPHMGAHVDAPSHLGGDGDAASIDIGRTMGDCVVIDCSGKTKISPEDLPQVLAAPRVLVKTGFVLGDVWENDYPALAPEAVRHLVQLGADVIGIDSPSIDAFAANDLPAHKVAIGAGCLIFENLLLQKVPAGLYTLVALPLKIEGLEASPVRAILLEKGSF